MDKSTAYFDDLKICHVNYQSLFAHFDEFQLFFMDADYHMISVRNVASASYYRCNGQATRLCPLQCDREGRTGGGVAFYLSNMLRAVVLESSMGSLVSRPEFIIAEILFKDTSKLLLVVVYQLLSSGYLNEFFQLFLEFQANYRHSIILGDFNADMLQCTVNSQQLKLCCCVQPSSRSVWCYSSPQKLQYALGLAHH